MNRRYTMAHYMAIVEALRRDLPDHSLSTDLIAGFPGETEEEFRATLRAVEEIRFDEAFTYAYSPREGTAACAMSEALTTEEKLARLDRLITLQRRISKEKLASRVGRGEELIVEALSRKSDREVMGRTFLNHRWCCRAPPGYREKLTVRITTLKGATLYGDRIA
jgi:tRNA-2-methylthio-N6-dimethylallyladenosine synthase